MLHRQASPQVLETTTMAVSTLTHAAVLRPDEGRWTAPTQQLAMPLRQPVWVPLDELGLIAASGPDARDFLQAQLTNDVAGLAADRAQLNGYCTPKGRLLAIFHNFRHGDELLLQCPVSVLPPVLRRLSMFILRSKTRLADVSTAWQTAAVVGAGAEAALRRVLGHAPAVGGLLNLDGVLVSREPAGLRMTERYLIRLPADRTQTLEALRRELPAVDSGVWWWSQIDAAVPTVLPATQEAFVPQMVNLEVLGGVSFRKGCYPGQEVVARSQYLGKLKRRMRAAHADGPAAAGQDVFCVTDRAEAIGKVVMAAAAPDGGWDLLFEAPLDRMEGALALGEATGPRLALHALPYELRDVTA
jgi:hypothetical protein